MVVKFFGIILLQILYPFKTIGLGALQVIMLLLTQTFPGSKIIENKESGVFSYLFPLNLDISHILNNSKYLVDLSLDINIVD